MRFSLKTKALLALAVLAGLILLLNHLSHCENSAGECALCNAFVVGMATAVIGLLVRFAPLGTVLSTLSGLPTTQTPSSPAVRGPPGS